MGIKNWVTSGKKTSGLIVVSLCLGLVITSLLSGHPVQFSEEIHISHQDFRWEFISPGIQRCTLIADPANNISLSVHLGFFYSDFGDEVNFQLSPGETRSVNLLSRSELKSPSYSIYEIMLSFNFTPSQLPQKLLSPLLFSLPH